MKKEGQFIFKNTHKLHYKVFGTGDKIAFCFHGFGQNADVFQNLPNRLKNHKIISFDLPFHGRSDFPERKLTKLQWKEFSSSLIDHFNVSKVSIFAYSIGGRFAIRFAIDHPEAIEHVTFIAADGFHYTGVYKFATSFLGKSLFKYLLKNPGKLFYISDQLSKMGVLNPSIVKFAKLQLGEKNQRIRVYNSWIYLKLLMTSNSEIIKSLNRSQLPVEIYAGSKDNVIKESYFSRIVNGYKNSTMVVLPKRHHEMIEAYIINESSD